MMETVRMMMSPPMEAVMRKLRRAGDPVRAMEGGGSTLKAYKQNRIRLEIFDQHSASDLLVGVNI